MRGGAVAARWAHNPKVGGSNPPPATEQKPQTLGSAVFRLKVTPRDFAPNTNKWAPNATCFSSFSLRIAETKPRD